MTQYVAMDHRPTSWHLSHYATRALTVGLAIVEATAVSRHGAVTPHDLGIWDDDQIPGLSEIAEVIVAGGAVAGLQLSHAGRKASRTRWWDGDTAIAVSDGGWPLCGPSPLPFSAGYPVPVALSEDEIGVLIEDFAAAAGRALRAGFRFLELHAGHGRLLHSFYSPVSNHRQDRWGGSFDNRIRFLVETVRAVRCRWPADLPLGVRLSCTDWVDGGWTLDDSVRLAAVLRECGVDLVDCTSGGVARPIQVPDRPLYQVPFATEIRRRAQVATAAVGLIQSVQEADDIVRHGRADIVLMGRKLLLDPFVMVRQAGWDDEAQELVPKPYQRAVRSLVAPEPAMVPEL